MITIAANTISGNEKALWLQERHEQSPTFGGFHRYQIISVIRDGRRAEWRKDMGLASLFKGINQINIPSFMEHTVDELMDLADELRGRPKLDVMDFMELNEAKLV
ncbi:hypothetical protein LCGC14_0349740 [marine sediment metagenome]|uniref:Uncharacterized protein n=1 Tax=marine sediment metagenome TaxID=412755 RepID=A0A0F9TU10_9ZZZZ